MAVHPEGEQILTSSDDGTARIWRLKDMSLEVLVARYRGQSNLRPCEADSKVIPVHPVPDSDMLWAPRSDCEDAFGEASSADRSQPARAPGTGEQE